MGVDIFFVISGYLITSILASDLAAGRFSIRKFYERRARRIFPALFFVMAGCLPFAWAWLTPGQLREFFQSVVAVTLFLSNVYFWLKSGYFGQNTEALPLIHTWSLAVEEQFYVVFPLLLLALWKLVPRVRSWLIGGIAFASFAACIYFQSSDPSFNFFFAPTRAWELLAGALVALHRKRWLAGRLAGTAWREAFGTLALVLIGGSIFLYTKDTPFPGWAAVPPVLGTALILAFCSPHTTLGRVLSWRPMVAIGLVSYSAYLWHQPLFAFARAVTPGPPTPALYAALIALTGVLAALSWRFVERPFRQPGRVSRPRIFWFSVATSLAFVAIGAGGHWRNGFPGRFDASSNQLAATSVASPLRAKCHTEGVAYLKPSMACRYFNGHATWAVFGDSHGVELAYALAEDLKPSGQGVLHLTSSGCQPALKFESNVPGCSAWIRESLALLENSPDIHDVVLVFRHSFYLYGDQVRGFPVLPDSAPAFLREQPANAARNAYWSSFFEIARRLKVAGKEVHVVDPIPELGTAIDRLIYRRDVFGGVAVQKVGNPVANYVQRNRSILPKLAELAAAGSAVRVISQDAFCDGVQCFAVMGGDAMYFDDNHPSVAGARRLARLLVPAAPATAPPVSAALIARIANETQK